MKYLISVAFVLYSFISNQAQSRIGSSFRAIKEEFPMSKFNIDFKELTDTSCVYAVKEQSVISIYLFDKLECTATFIIPQNSIILKSYLEDYNKRYVIISDKKWKAYLGNGICNIDLESPANGNLPFFLWTRAK